MSGIFASPSTAHLVHGRRTGTLARSVAPQPARIRQRPWHLDPGTGRPGLLGARHHRGADLRRKRASRLETAENQLEARQTLDYQPRSTIPAKKNARDNLIVWASQQPGWAIGFFDEVWWSRFALPRMSAWQSKEHPVRLEEQSWEKGDPDRHPLWLAMVCCGKRVSRMIPHATKCGCALSPGVRSATSPLNFSSGAARSWWRKGSTPGCWSGIMPAFHLSKIVRTWIREHHRASSNKQAKVCASCLSSYLRKAAFINPIEPKWVHGKRAVVEPTRLLSASELAQRICASFGCSYEPYLCLPHSEKVS